MPIGSMIQGIAAAAQATNDLGFGIYNAISQYRENKRNRQFAQDMAGYQNAVNRANWEAENAYNTPAMELQRMRVAGINPALAMSGNQSLSLAGSNMQPAAAVNASPLPAPQLNANPLLAAAQIRNIMADTKKKEAEARGGNAAATYQELQNTAEELIQNYPVTHYIGVTDSFGNESWEAHTSTVNLRVEGAKLKHDLDKMGVRLDTATLNDMYYNWFLLSGEAFNGVVLNSPEEDPKYKDWEQIFSSPQMSEARSALRGDYKVQRLSGDMAELDYEASQAQKAGMKEFERFLETHKDNPLVQLLLLFRGFLQTSAMSDYLPLFPHVSVKRSRTRIDHRKGN